LRFCTTIKNRVSSGFTIHVRQQFPYASKICTSIKIQNKLFYTPQVKERGEKREKEKEKASHLLLHSLAIPVLMFPWGDMVRQSQATTHGDTAHKSRSHFQIFKTKPPTPHLAPSLCTTSLRHTDTMNFPPESTTIYPRHLTSYLTLLRWQQQQQHGMA
jgi:hypothetical protein